VGQERVTLKASALDGYLGAADLDLVAEMDALYAEALPSFRKLEALKARKDAADERARAEEELTAVYNRIGRRLREITGKEERIVVYPFRSADERNAEASRLISKLRDASTGREEFVYYIQRAYELLFALAYGSGTGRSHLIVRTPVSEPERAYAVHKIPDIEAQVGNAAVCVMLRAALLPSMIVAKEIEEYTPSRVLAPFALFRIRREEGLDESGMEYCLDPSRSYYDLESIDGKDLIFADPMNATGGSLIAVLSFLRGMGVRPKSLVCLNVISALKGALRCIRAESGLKLYTLWMDPALNEVAYIMPGLGDAGDRINGADGKENPRDVLSLIADYGTGITGLYRSQIRMIESVVLRRRGA
jgi:uracil phosphoribosyltransferase